MILDLLKLWRFYQPEGVERGGYINRFGEAVELANHHPEPTKGFDPPTEDLALLEEIAIATFHTHPGGSSNLSDEDYFAFTNWPDLRHYIVGEDGITAYTVNDQRDVIRESIGSIPRLPEKAVS